MRRPPPSDLIIRNVEVDGRLVNVTVHDGNIRAIEPARNRAEAVEVLDGEGGALIPGLHDHHIHLAALAAAQQSLQFDVSFERAVQAQHASMRPGEWIRCVGYHESIIGELDRHRLDTLVGTRPIRVQHRSGAMWVLNSAALVAVDIESDSGRLFDADQTLRDRLPPSEPDLVRAARMLASFGVVGVTDLTPLSDLGDMQWLAAAASGHDFPLAVTVTGGPPLTEASIEGVGVGPVKIVVADHRLPPIDELSASVRRAHEAGRPVAMHCVTAVGLVIALTALGDVGVMPGDRIEHGSIIPVDTVPLLLEFGLTVVTQPSFVRARGDQYLQDVDVREIDDLWRCGTLMAAGVPVGGSTDAPFGDPDPWRAIAAAMHRTTESGRAIGVDERITAHAALAMFLTSPDAPGGQPRRIAVGEPGELCLLTQPLAEVLRDPDSRVVAATVSRLKVWRNSE